MTDALGNLVDFCLMPGQAHDLRETDTLICNLSAGHLLADRAFDADWLRSDLKSRNIIPVIPSKSNRRFPAEFDVETYKWRHLIENYFGKLKENRGIAMRSCKQIRVSRPSSRLQQQSFKPAERQQTLVSHLSDALK